MARPTRERSEQDRETQHRPARRSPPVRARSNRCWTPRGQKLNVPKEYRCFRGSSASAPGTHCKAILPPLHRLPRNSSTALVGPLCLV